MKKKEMDGGERERQRRNFVKVKMIISIWEFNAFVIHKKKHEEKEEVEKYRVEKERELWIVYMNGL